MKVRIKQVLNTYLVKDEESGCHIGVKVETRSDGQKLYSIMPPSNSSFTFLSCNESAFDKWEIVLSLCKYAINKLRGELNDE